MNLRIMKYIGLALLAIHLLATDASAQEKKQKPREYRDPELTIPWCRQAPKLDGQLSPGEWDMAACVSMLECYPCYWPRAMRQEQPSFFIFRDAENLYIAMESLDSNTTGVVASCVRHDDLHIIGDDCVELMIAPGAGERIKQYDFPTYYWALNSIDTIWDTKFITQLNEIHNDWESGIKVANGVDGTYWVCEMKIPLASIQKELPKDGTVWRMNFDRTYSGYAWSAWNAGGGLNDCRIGGNVTFDRNAPAVRQRSGSSLVDGVLKVVMEVANGTDKPCKVKFELSAVGDKEGDQAVAIGQDTKELTVNPGELKEVTLGKGEKLLASNVLVLKATDDSGKTLYFIERQVNIPVPWFAKKLAPKVPQVYVFPRFLPSLERLAVLVDYTSWSKKSGASVSAPTAEIKVWPKGQESGHPVMEGILTEFSDCKGTWRASTKDLPEGDYVVKVKVLSGKNTVLVDYDDWFVKKIFDWMKNPRGKGDAVPSFYTPLEVQGQTVKSWGRAYAFAKTGLPESIQSQGRALLTGEAKLQVEIDGKQVAPEIVAPLAFTGVKPAEVHGHSTLKAAELKIELESITEFDGFLLYRMTYGSEKDAVTVDRLRLKLPIAAKYAKYYSVAGDTQGTCIQGDVLPDKQGKVFDSSLDTRSVCCSPTFASLFWVGDHDVSLCYASDSDQGWLIRDDAPAVEAYREGETVNLWLNLVDKKTTLTAPRTLEFAFQAGPTKALPEGWRGIQDANVGPTEAPVSMIQSGGSGNSMPGGGQCFIHPGVTKEEQARSRKYLEDFTGRSHNKVVIGYTYWPMVPKGFEETRVFRGEWGIDKQTWDNSTAPATPVLWESRFFGENKDRYVILNTGGRPSYVDFLSYAYDLALDCTPLSGNYDDCGYPKPIYDEELGLGFIREDGRKIYSSGLWIYRDRWKRAAYINFQHKRPNYLSDSQHVYAHYMPAYNFIGLWRPCERGYYNPFKDRDNLEFYGSMNRYVVLNPSSAFGQVGQIGMSSPQTDPALQARDTRCMMMLVMLNDQDLGSFGAGRDRQTIGQLRAARNRFRPWDKEISFHGYWENERLLKSSSKDALVSVYQRPDAALFVVGNTGDADASFTVSPAWKELKLNPAQLSAVDAENDAAVPMKDSFTVNVKRHDLRVILVSAPGGFPLKR